MMGQNSSEAMQVIYMEVEGIKLAIQMTKDAVKFACQMMKYLICCLKNSPYKKVMGKTNKKNLKARANGQPLVPFTMDKRAYQIFKKMAAKYGILYYAFTPLHSGKVNSMQLMFAQSDLPMAQELMNQIKEGLIREDVKNGMDEEASRQNAEDNNRMESMEEFAQNTGVLVPPEVFEQKMKERFGENYESGMLSPNYQTVSPDKEKVEGLAEIINMEEYKEKIQQRSEIEIPFVYDEKNQKSDIIEQTDTHVKIAQKNLKEDGWNCVWVPKDRITPPLKEPVKEGERRTAHVSEKDHLIVEFPGKNKIPEKIEGKDLKKIKYDITLNKRTLCGYEETADKIKTRIPYKKDRFIWLEKKNMIDIHEGQSYLTFLEKDKLYEICDGDNQNIETVKGEMLWKYYNNADSSRKKAERTAYKMTTGGRKK